MELFNNKLMLHVPNFGLRIEVESYAVSDMIRALRPHLTDPSILSVLTSEENWGITLEEKVSGDLTYILDCIGKHWVAANKIQSIKLVRKVFDCGLREAKDAVEEYLA